MDELEAAVLVASGSAPFANRAEKERAVEYCQELKRGAAGSWRQVVDRFNKSDRDEVRFWCLQVIQELVTDRYSQLPQEDVLDLKGNVLGWLRNECLASSPEMPVFFKNKIAQVVVGFLLNEFPEKWPMFFTEMIATLQQGPQAADMFCRVLQSLNTDVISVDVARTPEQLQASMRVKDGMRDLCMNQIAEVWFELAAAYQQRSPHLAAFVLETTSCTINWIDISLVANEKFLSLVFSLMLTSPDSRLRAAATDFVLEIVVKRMDAGGKLQLLERLSIVECCNRLPLFSVEEDVALKYAELLSATGAELLDCQHSASSAAQAAAAGQGLLAVVPLIVSLLRSTDEALFGVSVAFISNYVGKLKQLDGLPQPQIECLRNILAACASKSQYPTDEDFNADPLSSVALELEEEVGECRRELFTIFRNAAGLVPVLAYDLVGNALHALYQQGADAAFQEVEVAITLLFQLAESPAASPQALSREGALFQLACLLMDQPPPCGNHRLVTLAYMECIVRFSKVLSQHEQALATVLAAFLDQRGIRHIHSGVSSRAAYLFMRLVKVIRQQLLPFLNDIFASLQPALEDLISGVKVSVKHGAVGEELDDRLYAFEAVGLLLGQEQIAAEQQELHLKNLMVFMCRQLEANTEIICTNGLDHLSAAMRVAYIVQGMSYLSKAFTPHMCRLRPALGVLFADVLALLTKTLGPLQSQKLARDRAVSFVHRMIETLGPAVVPYLGEIFQSLMRTTEHESLLQTSTLLVQVLNKLSQHVSPLLELVLPKLLLEMMHHLPEESGGTSKSAPLESEIAREASDLLRAWFALLHALTTNGCANNLLQVSCVPFLPNITSSLITGSSSRNQEVSARKMCLQCLGALVGAWCVEDGANECVPGFRQFVLDRVVPEVCLGPIFRGEINAKDAAQSGLLGEMAVMLICLYKQCGEAAGQYLVSKVLPSQQCPPSLLGQFLPHMQSGNPKELRTFLRAVAEQCRICALNGTTPP